ncbi:MAG: DUF6769 family protein [Bacteroidales bacterium]
MIKRITAILLIFLANVMLLVHAAIPHHHHHGQVCFLNDNIQGNTQGNNHEDGNSDCCNLKQDFILPSDDNPQKESKCLVCDTHHTIPLSLDFYVIIGYAYSFRYNPDYFLTIHPEYSFSTIKDITANGVSLRAPPAII